jgi:hypothetical protein
MKNLCCTVLLAPTYSQRSLSLRCPLTGAADLDEYLPPDTLNWCRAKMAAFGFDPLSVDCEIADLEGEKPFVKVYLSLRQEIADHLGLNTAPILTETEQPLGAYDWLREREQRGRELLDLAPLDEEQVNLIDDGPDPGIVDSDYVEELG